MNEEDFYKREISIDDRLHGDLDAAEDILSELESGWENVYPPKKIFEKIKANDIITIFGHVQPDGD